MIQQLIFSAFVVGLAWGNPTTSSISRGPLNTTLAISYSSETFYRTVSAGGHAIRVKHEEGADDNLDDDDEEDDVCEFVPKPNKEDDVETVSLWKLLEKTKDQLELRGNDGILLLGNTGSGKTTVTQIIAGDISKLNVYRGTGGHLIILDQEQKIGVTTKSRTLIPELVTDTTNNLNLYDCPGYTDNRGENADITANFLMKEVTDFLTSIRLIFVVSSAAVSDGGRTMFNNLVTSATRMVKSLDKLEKGIGMIVTKVRNYSNSGKMLKDARIRKNIQGYLTQYKKDQESSLSKTVNNETRIQLERKVKFVDILLQNNRISFLRNPDRCGPLNQSQFIETSKEGILMLIMENLQPVPCNKYDFGYAVSDNTLNKITALKNHVNNEAINFTSILVGNLRRANYYRTLDMKTFFKMKNFVGEEYGNFSQVVNQISSNNSLSLLGKLMPPVLVSRGYNSNQGKRFESNMKALQSYREFFEMVSDQEQSPEDVPWKKPLQNWVADLSMRKEWFDFLFSLRSVFSTFEFQAKKPLGIPTTMDELKAALLGESSSIVTDKVIQLYNQREVIFHEELQIVWKLTEEAFRKVDIQCKEIERPSGSNNFVVEMTVMGSFIKSSEFSYFPRDSPTCSRVSASPGIVKVFATRTVFFDEKISSPNESLYDHELAIVAPKWEVIAGVTSQQINLSGRNGAEIPKRRPTPTAPQLSELGQQMSPSEVPLRLRDQCREMGGGGKGLDGRSGELGFPGGQFIGIYERIQGGERLLISANGGDGSDGEAGEVGGTGEEGKDFPFEQWPTDYNDMKRFDHHDSCWETTQYVSRLYSPLKINRHHCITYGCPGGLGGKGGDGGSKGLGGLKGRIELLSLIGPVVVKINVSDGTSGIDGTGGPGGLGGKRGNGWKATMELRSWSDRLGIGSVWFWPEPIQTYDRSTDGGWGRGGLNSSVGQKSRRKPSFTLSRESVVLEYKKFAILGGSVLFQDEFIPLLESSSEVAKAYTPLTFAKELLVLEEINLEMRNREKREKVSAVLLPAYESLIDRIETFTKEAKEQSEADKILLSLLFSTVLNQARTLKQVFGTLVVLDVNSYLVTLEQRIKDAEEANIKQLVENERTRYGIRFEQKIRETMTFIKDSVDPALKSTEAELEKVRIELKEEVANLVVKEIANVEVYKRQKEQMKNSMVLRGFCSFLQIGAAALTIFGGPIAPLGVIVGGVTTAVKELGLGDLPSVLPLNKVPPGVQKVSDDLEKRSKVLSREGLGVVSVLVKESQKAVAENLELLGGLTPSINTLENSVVLLGNGTFSGSMKEFSELGRKIKIDEKILQEKLMETVSNLERKRARRSLEAEEAIATATTPKIPNGTQKAQKAVEKVVNALKTAGELGLELYEVHKNDADKLAEISGLIDEASSQLQSMKKYEEAVSSVLGPLTESAIEDLEIAKKDMKGKSEVFLRMQRWKVGNIFRQYGTNLNEFVEGFPDIERKFRVQVEIMQQGMSLMIDLYTFIDKYNEQMEFANYLANIQSPEAKAVSLGQEEKAVFDKITRALKASLVLQEWDTAFQTFQQWIFPFKDEFPVDMTSSGIPNYLESISDVNKLLLPSIKEKVKKLIAALSQYRAGVFSNIDTSLVNTDFDSNRNSLYLFYEWRNELHCEQITKLLSGEKITISASPDYAFTRGMAAVKFRVAAINLKLRDSNHQNEFEKQMSNLKVIMTHSGFSKYLYKDMSFDIVGNQLTFEYNLEIHEVTKEPTGYNDVYRKVKGGDLILSPYTIWTVLLSPVKTDRSFNFTRFANEWATKVDMELVGKGSFVRDTKSLESLNDMFTFPAYFKSFEVNLPTDL